MTQPGPEAYLFFVAFFCLAFGLMQTVALSQRHITGQGGTHRIVGLTALLAAILFGALAAFGDGAGWGHRLAWLVAFAVLLVSLGLLAASSEERRFGPLSSLALIVVGAVLLKLAQAMR
ncbi:MAG: hypothetical protein AAF415_02025 [Pseudomonadota bacterium]